MNRRIVWDRDQGMWGSAIRYPVSFCGYEGSGLVLELHDTWESTRDSTGQHSEKLECSYP